MSASDFDTFLTLGETLSEAGWEIVKFENLGGSVTLTIIPKQQKAAEAEA
jgi:hypothetical protein